MYQRCFWHLEDRGPLSGIAYFCLSVLEQAHGGRHKAATHLAISAKVLDRIGQLGGGGGGVARKGSGRTVPITPEDERFLKSAFKTVIWRTAEVECAPDCSRARSPELIFGSIPVRGGRDGADCFKASGGDHYKSRVKWSDSGVAAGVREAPLRCPRRFATASLTAAPVRTTKRSSIAEQLLWKTMPSRSLLQLNAVSLTRQNTLAL